MKKLLSLIAAIAIAATSGIAHADVLAFDNFDYADGSLVPNGGWASHSGTAGDFLVSGGQAVVQHGTPSEDVNLSFASVAGDVFYGIDFSVDDLGAPFSGSDAEYFVHFKDAGFNFSARLDIVAPTSTGDFTVGIASDESTADTIWGSDLIFGRTYRAVVRYDQAENIAQLWIDASLESDTSIFGEDRPNPGDPVSQIALRQSDSSENETIRVDGLVVGTTFVDVVSAAAIPEPSSIAILAIGFVGVVSRRRRA